MSAEIRGLDSALKRLDKLVSKEEIENKLEQACLLVERTARQRAPKGNGQLRNSIQHKVKDLEGIVFSNLEYAPYVEYGTGLFAEEGGRTDVPWSYQDEEGEWHTTKGQHPHPFMRPALDENRKRIVELFREAKK